MKDRGWRTGYYLALAVGLATSLPTHAKMVRLHFKAMIRSMDDRSGLLAGLLSNGMVFTGSFAYDNETLDTNPDPLAAERVHRKSGEGFSINLGSLKAQSDPVNPLMSSQVIDARPGDLERQDDMFHLHSNSNHLPLASGLQVTEIDWRVQQYSKTVLMGTALPQFPLDLSQWESNQVIIRARADTSTAHPMIPTLFILAHVVSMAMDSSGLQGHPPIFVTRLWNASVFPGPERTFFFGAGGDAANRFEAKGLPAGVTLSRDSANPYMYFLTAGSTQFGAYPVTLELENSFGKAAKKVWLFVGIGLPSYPFTLKAEHRQYCLAGAPDCILTAQAPFTADSVPLRITWTRAEEETGEARDFPEAELVDPYSLTTQVRTTQPAEYRFQVRVESHHYRDSAVVVLQTVAADALSLIWQDTGNFPGAVIGQTLPILWSIPQVEPVRIRLCIPDKDSCLTLAASAPSSSGISQWSWKVEPDLIPCFSCGKSYYLAINPVSRPGLISQSKPFWITGIPIGIQRNSSRDPREAHGSGYRPMSGWNWKGLSHGLTGRALAR